MQTPHAALVEHVGVNHRGVDASESEQFLDGPDVVAILEQVRGERVPERVACHPLGDSASSRGVFHRALYQRLVKVDVPAPRSERCASVFSAERPTAMSTRARRWGTYERVRREARRSPTHRQYRAGEFDALSEGGAVGAR